MRAPSDGYTTFLESKSQLDGLDGFKPLWLPDFLFPFQFALTSWAVEKGRAAIFADCGLGKTPMQLVWAENVRQHTGKPVLIVTPLQATATSSSTKQFVAHGDSGRPGRCWSI